MQVISSDATEIFARLKSAAFHELVISSMKGEDDAIATLFTWIRPAIVRYCRSRIGRSGSAYSSADDVAQEICVAVLGALGITAYLGGAVTANMRVEAPVLTHILFAVYLGVLMWVGLAMRRPELLKVVGLRRD